MMWDVHDGYLNLCSTRILMKTPFDHLLLLMDVLIFAKCIHFWPDTPSLISNIWEKVVSNVLHQLSVNSRVKTRRLV